MIKAVSERFDGISSSIEVSPSGFVLHMENSKPLTFQTLIAAVSYDICAAWRAGGDSCSISS